jgi:hypothetical protein
MTQRAIATTVVQSLLSVIADKQSAPAVRGACWLVLDDLKKWMDMNPPDPSWETV